MYKAINNIREQKGFTLIELLIVVAIIGILAAIAVPAYIGAQEKARKSNLQKAGKSAESDIQHWLNSAYSVYTDQSGSKALLREVDSDWDGSVTIADDTNAVVAGTDAAEGTVAAYAAARVTEMSPWNGMNGCATTLFTVAAKNLPRGVAADPCTVALSAIDPPAGAITGNQINIILTSNGPGGNDTANKEYMNSNTVTAE